ncbi:MBL fold metallo-hydrolase [Kosakonia cowanii]|uniref:MBL fold metallo-hydrolase n=1 Tax=Kosakonia cowanii TaxID=208223 RepID=UPI003EE7A837
MKIDVLGCGSAFSRQQNTSAIRVIDREKRQWLIDCGPTIPRALWQRNLEINEIDALYFTHVHPDHCTGLTALLNHWKSFQRRKPLIIWSQREQRPVLMQLASLANWPQAELGFPIEWRDSEAAFHWQGWQIHTAFTHHEIPNLALRIEADGRTLFYSGDGRPTAESIALMHNADLAFQECASLTALGSDASHGDFPDCLALYQQLHLPALGLYHCNDAALAALAEACAPYPGLFLSEDGRQFDLLTQQAAHYG